MTYAPKGRPGDDSGAAPKEKIRNSSPSVSDKRCKVHHITGPDQFDDREWEIFQRTYNLGFNAGYEAAEEAAYGEAS